MIAQTAEAFTCHGCGEDKEGAECQNCGSTLIQVAGWAPLDSVEDAARAVRLDAIRARYEREKYALWG